MDANRLVAVLEGGVRFGIGDPALLSAQLRTLADAIELGYAAIETIQVTQEVSKEDFPMTTLILSYCEHRMGGPEEEEPEDDDGPDEA